MHDITSLIPQPIHKK